MKRFFRRLRRKLVVWFWGTWRERYMRCYECGAAVPRTDMCLYTHRMRHTFEMLQNANRVLEEKRHVDQV